MKKRLSVLAVLVMAVAITAYSVTGTFARYTTTTTEVSDGARVASWKLNDIATMSNLFTASYAASNSTEASPATDVNALVDVVAPGTSGSYKFQITGSTETNYTLSISATATDTINTSTYAPIVYTLDGVAVTDQNNDSIVDATDLAKAIENLYAADHVYAAGTVSESEHTIGWSWAIDGNNEKDTALASDIVEDADSHKVSLSVKVTATQDERAAGTYTAE